MSEYHDGRWVVYTIPYAGGFRMASCWIGVSSRIPDNCKVLYEGDSYDDAQQYIEDVRDIAIKPFNRRDENGGEQ